MVGYANGNGGVMFVGVSNEGEAVGLTLDEIDKTKLLFVMGGLASFFLGGVWYSESYRK